MKKSLFVKYIVQYGWLLAMEAILIAAVSQTIVKGNTIVSQVIDEMLAGKKVVLESFLIQFLVFTMIGFVAAFVQRLLAAKYALLICTKYRNAIVQKLYRLEYRYFDTNHSATVLNKVAGDFSEINDFLESLLPEILGSLISLVIYAIYIGKLNIQLFILIIFCYPIIFKIANILMQKIAGLNKTYREKTDTMTEITQDAVNGILDCVLLE